MRCKECMQAYEVENKQKNHICPACISERIFKESVSKGK